MIQITISNNTHTLLQNYFNKQHENDIAKKTAAIEALAHLNADIVANPQKSKWNARPLRYEGCYCGVCGEHIPVGEKAWITTGQSPRCFKHGKPTD
jgi:hypothetical protein